MSTEYTTIELERPEGWRGEDVDMSTYEGEVDYFECEVEAQAVIEIDNNYGADRDGRRGCTMDFSYVEDIQVFLDGDFRPFFRKVKDFFRATLMRKAWASFPDNKVYTFLRLDEDVLDQDEIDSITETCLENAANWEPDYEPDYDY